MIGEVFLILPHFVRNTESEPEPIIRRRLIPGVLLLVRVRGLLLVDPQNALLVALLRTPIVLEDQP